MKKIILLLTLLTSLPACFNSSPSSLVFDDSTAAKGSRSIASASVAQDYSLVPYVADRAFVESTLNQVFGPATDTVVETAVYRKKEFGGACDRYAASDNGTSNFEFPRAQCFSGMGVVLPSNSNPMRYAFTAKICETLVNTAARFNFAMKNIYPSWVTTQKLPAADAVAISKAYQAFFQSETPSAEVVSSLMDLSASATSTDEGWKQIILTLCVSPEWQTF